MTTTSSTTSSSSSSSSGLFSAPAPIRTLFSSFPLAIHPAESLPARSPPSASASTLPRLYLFSCPRDADLGLPSFNPTCLKWQTILKIANVDVQLVPSSNHASPSGSLPFLLLSSSASSPLTGEKITRFAHQHAPNANLDDPSPRIDAYQALITYQIRPAWLYSLYINPANTPLLDALYLLPSSALLRPTQRHTLRAAAMTEILKTTRRTTGGVDQDLLLDGAQEAFAALAALLGEEEEWFLGGETPGVLDAQVFAYTHLLLGGQLAWEDKGLVNVLSRFGNLVRHAQRLHQRYW